MKKVSIIEAPLVSEKYFSGVAHMAETLRRAGLPERVRAVQTTGLPMPRWRPLRDPDTQIINPAEVRAYTIAIADAVEQDIAEGFFPLVVGGDCTILLGCLLAEKRRGRTGLFFLDGHADFYEPGVSPSGETADMELRLAVGRGPDVITNIEGRRPLVQESDVILFGFRDEAMVQAAGGEDVRKTGMTCFSLYDIRLVGFSNAVEQGIEALMNRVDRFWIHLDVDVLDDAVMPAVDYRMPNGVSIGELVSVLRRLFATEKAVGMSLAIFNPTLDPDGMLARRLVETIGAAFETNVFLHS